MNFARLLVFCPDLPEESLLIVPALRMLRQAYPEATIVLGTRLSREITSLTAIVDQVLKLQQGSDCIKQIAALHCDGAIIFTARGESPYPDGYRCYLAGIPFRAGISSEFSGGVLSHWVKPLPTNTGPVDHYLSLVASIGSPGVGAPP